MSYDTATAHNQGISAATHAYQTIPSLGFTSGTVLYDDMEGYPQNDASCKAAVKSWVSGWDSQLQSYGIVPGLYGSAYLSAMHEMATTVNPPPAQGFIGDWNHAVDSAWNLNNVPNSDWVYDARTHQYDANKPVGYGYTFAVDHDCSIGLVAGLLTADDESNLEPGGSSESQGVSEDPATC